MADMTNAMKTAVAGAGADVDLIEVAEDKEVEGAMKDLDVGSLPIMEGTTVGEVEVEGAILQGVLLEDLDSETETNVRFTCNWILVSFSFNIHRFLVALHCIIQMRSYMFNLINYAYRNAKCSFWMGMM